MPPSKVVIVIDAAINRFLTLLGRPLVVLGPLAPLTFHAL